MNKIDLGLPDENICKNFIPKNQFYEHGQFNQSDKRAFIKGIEKIILYSQLTKENTNIDEYKDEIRHYKEVSVVIVKLRDRSFMDKISRLIMSTIPYPMLLIGIHKDEIIFYVAHHRESRADKDKTVLEDIYNTDFLKTESSFISDINYKNLNKQNLYTFYDSYVQAVLDYNLKKRNIRPDGDKEELLEEIFKLEAEIDELRNLLQKEKHFNRQMDLNVKIKRLETKLKKMGG